MQSSIMKKISLITLISIVCITSFSQDSKRFYDEVFDEIDIQHDVVYGKNVTQAGVVQELTMDIYMPKNDTMSNRPLMVMAHGGYFIFGDKDSFSKECKFLAQSGYVAVSINYRLIDIEGDSVMTPKYAVIDAVNDMKAAVRYFTKDASTDNKYKIDSDNIFVGGYSAGAITSLHYAYATTADDVLQMGGTELLKYVKKNGGVDGNSGNEGYPSKIKGVVNIAGSLHSAKLLDKGEPALYSVHGTADITVPYNKGLTGETLVETEGSGLIHKQASKVGIKNLLHTLQDLDHSGFYFCDECPNEMREFIGSVAGY
jgi:dienelactone hydrolase